MHIRNAILALSMGAGVLAAVPVASAQTTTPPTPIEATLDATHPATPVSDYVFGMFIEHIGKTMYGPLWAEMLDDRKFYFPITDNASAPASRRGFPGMTMRHWHPVGPQASIAMDTAKPFVGQQSPAITLDGTTPHGIQQSGLALVQGKVYTGHIWLRGTAGSKVRIVLTWSNGSQTWAISPGPHTTVGMPQRSANSPPSVPKAILRGGVWSSSNCCTKRTTLASGGVSRPG